MNIRYDDRTGGNLQPVRYKKPMDFFEQTMAEVIRLEQMAELAERGLVRRGLEPRLILAKSHAAPDLKRAHTQLTETRYAIIDVSGASRLRRDKAGHVYDLPLQWRQSAVV